VIDLALDALSVYRLTHLVTDDAILDGARAAYVDRMVESGHAKFAEVVQCSWCTGVWCAFGVVVARRAFPRAWSAVARALAFSAVAGILSER
jgi:hypothetical protein